MAAIGSLVFCSDCGNLLDANIDRKAYLSCEVCGKQNEVSAQKVISTTSKPSAFPSSLRTRLRSDVADMDIPAGPSQATIQRTCEKCGEKEVRYYSQQLRSADEGSTIFYTCPNPDCRNKWTEQN